MQSVGQAEKLGVCGRGYCLAGAALRLYSFIVAPEHLLDGVAGRAPAEETEGALNAALTRDYFCGQ